MTEMSFQFEDKSLPTSEADPTGKSPHQPGAKLDAGKNRMGLVLGGFARALTGVSWIGTFGAAKYTDNGWTEVENAKSRYFDALFRHLMKHMSGERLDPDSGYSHLRHAAWNLLAVLEFDEQENDTHVSVARPGSGRAGPTPKKDRSPGTLFREGRG